MICINQWTGVYTITASVRKELIDLQKAFNTIDHEILLKKIWCIGFSEKVISWFESYLSGRTFKVNINEKFLDPRNFSCGVPQGSILGPRLFLLYVNDMSQVVKCDLFLYADDTCHTLQHENVKEIEDSWIWICLASVIGLSTTNQAFIWSKIRLSPYFLKLNLTLNELDH